ncbi:MAG: hypothetical protein LUD76_11940 [Alistipes sp.]|nr:hypothetical protein [Alistipes sp.]
MDKNLRTYLFLPLGLLLLAALPLTSCSDDEKGPVSELVLSATSAAVKVGGVASDVEITEGNGKYVVESSDEKVCVVTVSGSVLSLRGMSEGTATVTVTDAKNKTANLAVTVSAQVDEPVRIKLERYGSGMDIYARDRVRIISGNGGYSLTSGDIDIVEAALDDDTVILYGHSVGETTVEVTDSEGQQCTIEVTVKDRQYPLSTSAGLVVMENGNGEVIEIVNGKRGYTVESSDEAVVTASIFRDGEDGPLSDARYYIRFEPGDLGEAVVTLSDDDGQQLEIAAKVNLRMPLQINWGRVDQSSFMSIDDLGDDIWRMIVLRGSSDNMKQRAGELYFDLPGDLPEGGNYYLTLEYTGHERAGFIAFSLYSPTVEGAAFTPMRPSDSSLADALIWPVGCWWVYNGAEGDEPARIDNEVYGTKSYEITTRMQEAVWSGRQWGKAGDYLKMNFGFAGYLFRLKSVSITSSDVTDEWMNNYDVGA